MTTRDIRVWGVIARTPCEWWQRCEHWRALITAQAVMLLCTAVASLRLLAIDVDLTVTVASVLMPPLGLCGALAWYVVQLRHSFVLPSLALVTLHAGYGLGDALAITGILFTWLTSIVVLIAMPRYVKQ